ncbi:MAG: tRNA (guanosine(37)-N1)-methyltransferase TrmD [Francisellaceae bacterium]|nr:tRNA (guanosine(37)-N1)-methyltransferase TrmD [Francisellaceae bacterium]MBT6207962.1 tRNA (guanosine(37)-N1)-methyltransferase TrmD [Francisellaceae bacterium]MBT6539899.1 tRNA (guanosine(37)-N1)-methyltransferase TrmD [Francisellaceae bacterium]
MEISVITLFPEMFASVTEYGVVGRAIREKILKVELINLRSFSQEHRNGRIDDRPYGGGPGMVLQAEPLKNAVIAAKGNRKRKVVYLSPQGDRLNQQKIKDNAGVDCILIAGRYEGIDERFIDTYVDEQWSIGDYVLSGGELAAMVYIDAVARWLPGTLGHEESVNQDTFADNLLDCPHYTRPEVFADCKVPKVLLSGDHRAIAKWRRMQKLGRTWQKRPDLMDVESLDSGDRALLEEYLVTVGE